MKTFQIIARNGLTRTIEAESESKSPHVIEFNVQGHSVAMFRTETIVRVEAFDDGAFHEIIFPYLEEQPKRRQM